MLAFWQSLAPQIQAAVISGGVTLVAAVLGFGGIIWQIGRQARNAIRQNRDNEATKLKLEIYKQIAETCEAATDAGIGLSGFIRLLFAQTELVRAAHKAGQQCALPSGRTPDLLQKLSSSNSAAIRIVTTIEQWQIIDARMDVFTFGINVALHDLREAFHGQFFPAILPAIPVANPQTSELFPWLPLPEDQTAELKRRGDAVISAVETIVAYVDDFRREMQNLLLGQLFHPNQVKLREPLDPDSFPIRLDQRDTLVRHFKNDTAWGHNNKKTDADVRSAILKKRDTIASRQKG